jgi:hypothetical protein
MEMADERDFAEEAANRELLDEAKDEAELTTSVEREAREFAAEFPTPNVLRAVALAESGRLTWEQIHGLFRKSLGVALSV